ncbi:MAG: superoxide dismutase [Planctomycetes bacterium]|nr:superoxide dismutase [Planctomycetota bacterium]
MSLLVLVVVGTAGLWFGWVDDARAHCQVPCGIYDDAARIARLKEDATTIGKAIAQIGELGAGGPKALNQAVRWVSTKEQHATHIIDVVSEYFLTQKVKPVAADAEGYDAYLKKLAAHHAVMVAAMKTKQDAAPATVESLNKAIDALAAYY